MLPACTDTPFVAVCPLASVFSFTWGLVKIEPREDPTVMLMLPDEVLAKSRAKKKPKDHPDKILRESKAYSGTTTVRIVKQWYADDQLYWYVVTTDPPVLGRDGRSLSPHCVEETAARCNKTFDVCVACY